MIKHKTLAVKSYWDKQARELKTSPLATAPDLYYRRLEIHRIEDYLKNGVEILDVGCGNGFSTLKFAEKFPKSDFLGVDYSAEMIKEARKNLAKKPRLRERVEFALGDVLELSRHPKLGHKKFDLIVSERCLINLSDWPQQREAIIELKRLLKPKGKIILCENTQEGLQRLNALRKDFGLAAIKVRWHNFYLPEKKFLPFVRKNFKLRDARNIGSLYYLISRVVYAKLAALEGRQPDYMHPINKIASQLPLMGNYSPNFIFILENK